MPRIPHETTADFVVVVFVLIVAIVIVALTIATVALAVFTDDRNVYIGHFTDAIIRLASTVIAALVGYLAGKSAAGRNGGSDHQPHPDSP